MSEEEYQAKCKRLINAGDAYSIPYGKRMSVQYSLKGLERILTDLGIELPPRPTLVFNQENR